MRKAVAEALKASIARDQIALHEAMAYRPKILRPVVEATDVINVAKSTDRAVSNFITETKRNVENGLMELAIGTIFDKIIQEEMGDSEDYEIGHRTIRNFVESEGYSNLIKRFSRENLILSEMARLCEEYKEYLIEDAAAKAASSPNSIMNKATGVAKGINRQNGDSMMNKLKAASFGNASNPKSSPPAKTPINGAHATKGSNVPQPSSQSSGKTTMLGEADNDLLNDTCYKMDKTIADDFVEKIQELVPNRSIKMIRTRVANSMQNFLDHNAENKAAIMDIYNKASENSHALDGIVKEDYVQLSKVQANRVYSRPTSVLGAMINEFAKKIMADENLRYQYITEDNRLDMDKIVNANVVMYTVLEELNTMNMVKFTPEYLKKTLSSIN